MQTLKKILAAIFTIILSPLCIVLALFVGLITAPDLIAEVAYWLSGQKKDKEHNNEIQ